MTHYDDDVASADEHDEPGSRIEPGGLDLSPRTGPDGSGASPRSGGRKWPWLIVLGIIVVGIGFVITQAITQASLYYLNTDEAVAQRAEQGARTFRMQGTVVEGSKRTGENTVDFKLEFNGVAVDVAHKGAPPQLFQECVPVVVEGHWRSADAGTPAVFDSNNIIVAHDEQYEAENSDRIQKARAEGAEGSNACVRDQALGGGGS